MFISLRGGECSNNDGDSCCDDGDDGDDGDDCDGDGDSGEDGGGKDGGGSRDNVGRSSVPVAPAEKLTTVE